MKLLRAHWLLLCRLAPVLGVSLGGVAIEAALAQQNVSGGIRHSQLRGVSSSVIFSTVNRNDARAALKVWFDIVARERGFLLDSTVDILDSVTEIRERLRSHSVELVTMGAVDYLDLESGNLVVPVLTDARSSQGGALYSYVLLVNSSSGATSIASLQGKNLLVASRDGANTGIVWLERLPWPTEAGTRRVVLRFGQSARQGAGMHFASVLRRRGCLRGGRGQSESGQGDESSVGPAQGARPIPPHDRKRNRRASGTASIPEGAD